MTKSSERAAESSEARQSGNPAYGSTSSHFKITLYNPSAKHKREESSAKVHVNMKVQHCYLNWNMTTTEKQRRESWPFPSSQPVRPRDRTLYYNGMVNMVDKIYCLTLSCAHLSSHRQSNICYYRAVPVVFRYVDTRSVARGMRGWW